MQEMLKVFFLSCQVFRVSPFPYPKQTVFVSLSPCPLFFPLSALRWAENVKGRGLALTPGPLAGAPFLVF